MTNFYKSISDNYEKIFPLNLKMVDFIFESSQGKNYLDIACGTGLAAEELVKRGKKLKAIDLECSMVEAAKDKGIDAAIMNMLDLDFDEKFDLVYCVGNSLAHLESFEEVETFINKVKMLLDANGVLIVQLVNFSKYLGKGDDFLGKLPSIENQGITFDRKYFAHGDKIRFYSILYADGQILENNQLLLPIEREHLEKVLIKLGFKCEFFGGFDKSLFEEDKSFHLVIRASLGE